MRNHQLPPMLKRGNGNMEKNAEVMLLSEGQASWGYGYFGSGYEAEQDTGRGYLDSGYQSVADLELGYQGCGYSSHEEMDNGFLGSGYQTRAQCGFGYHSLFRKYAKRNRYKRIVSV
ncbi:hypothetical protein ACFL2Q_07245 [Thermodesulfobacteriota bacterium]